jgi:hypothetical protein
MGYAFCGQGHHPSAFEHSTDFAAAHAYASTCDRGFAVAVQHQPNGRSDEAVLHDGITGVARTIGASIPPMFVGLMFSKPRLINVPFFISGTLKIAYDLLLFRQFGAIQPPEEKFR